MRYEKVIEGSFHVRLNRFVAQVWIGDTLETVHVKNTGRCRELLVPGAKVSLSVSDNPKRKTKYDLVAVQKQTPEEGQSASQRRTPGEGQSAVQNRTPGAKCGKWVNIDSQAPNQVVKEWLMGQDVDVIRPEYTYGKSRIDFYLEKGERKIFMEVKGCTLEVDGIGYFPDAPTERGVKHLRELTAAVGEGYECYVAFVIPMEGVQEVRPNARMHAEFAKAFAEAEEAGVQILYLGCLATAQELMLDRVKKK